MSKKFTFYQNRSASFSDLSRADAMKMAAMGFYSSRKSIHCYFCKQKSLTGTHTSSCILSKIFDHVYGSLFLSNYETESPHSNLVRLTSIDLSVQLIDLLKLTFTSWPHSDSSVISSQNMAEGGFISMPMACNDDSALCPWCLVTLDGWEEEDNVIEEHRKRSDQCPFIWAFDNKLKESSDKPAENEGLIEPQSSISKLKSNARKGNKRSRELSEIAELNPSSKTKEFDQLDEDVEVTKKIPKKPRKTKKKDNVDHCLEGEFVASSFKDRESNNNENKNAADENMNPLKNSSLEFNKNSSDKEVTKPATKKEKKRGNTRNKVIVEENQQMHLPVKQGRKGKQITSEENGLLLDDTVPENLPLKSTKKRQNASKTTEAIEMVPKNQIIGIDIDEKNKEGNGFTSNDKNLLEVDPEKGHKKTIKKKATKKVTRKNAVKNEIEVHEFIRVSIHDIKVSNTNETEKSVGDDVNANSKRSGRYKKATQNGLQIKSDKKDDQIHVDNEKEIPNNTKSKTWSRSKVNINNENTNSVDKENLLEDPSNIKEPKSDYAVRNSCLDNNIQIEKKNKKATASNQTKASNEILANESNVSCKL